MGSDDHFVQGKQWIGGVGWFLLEYIQSSAGNSTFAQRLGEGVLIDNRTTCGSKLAQVENRLSVKPSRSMSGWRFAMMSATMRADPQAIVQPR